MMLSIKSKHYGAFPRRSRLPRADRVRQYMTEEAKLDPKRTEIATRGANDPIADNKSPDSRAKNRRVEIVIGVAR